MLSKKPSNTQVKFKYIPSFSKYILATQCIQITPFKSPMNPLAFKLCTFTPIHSIKSPFQIKIFSWCEIGFWTLKSLKSNFVHHNYYS